MMRAKNKGLDDSIWASRGKSSNYYNSSSSSSYRSRPNPPSTSVITPATPQPPSPTKPSRNDSVNTNTNTNPSPPPPPPPTPTPASNTPRSVTPNPSAAATNGTKPPPSSQQEFKRYIQIVRRLKWKLPYLSHGYHLAIAKPGDPLFGGETNAQEAELMFKLDFYEYYMLLERALVHLLGVFGATVPRDASERWMPPAARNGAAGYSTHTYHENVLAVLQREDNPLREALGSGEVLFHLSRAKELRNRWKYAEEASGAKKEETGRRRERDGTAPLESYDLDRIFMHVFAGFDAGYAIAERRVAEDSGVKAGEMGGYDFGKEMEIEEDEFDFMVEAMDWEAV
ncbi:uncharacterized protein CTRU02_211855 [Colletotrichum truncatum]|uniref:Uncharacterized protein n=1 Tax=Colletotrichum truncatum TaxID=5467 RepID=A0ACC3YM22_COLTU|nr:uncharacterized protein CTRU02_07265 [Colletotrichum truncatum]KAF6791503.1 hypothetical protein CTRU02_07265 [Colletotrichum truncatum]